MKPRVTWTAKLANALREYYRCTLPDAALNKAICFSTPQFNTHACNCLAKLPNDETCTFCGNNPKKLCEYTCDINKFCLATFAYRLGIGGEDLLVAVKKNLELDYPDLVKAIFDVFAMEPTEEKIAVNSGIEPEIEPETASTEEIEMPEVDPNYVEPEIEEVIEVAPKPEDFGDEDLVTIAVAAKIWGCTSQNLYAKAKLGVLSLHSKPDTNTKYVSRTEMAKLKSTKRSRKNTKKVEA